MKVKYNHRVISKKVEIESRMENIEQTTDQTNVITPYSMKLIRQWLIILLPMIILMYSVSAVIYLTEKHYQYDEMSHEEEAHITILKNSIIVNMNVVYSDLFFLAENHHLKSYVNSGEISQKKMIAHDYLSFSNHREFYDQIRFLNENGKEIVRINRKESLSVIVPDEELQEKGNRYYFKNSLSQGVGEFYISAFDLNVENQKIEKPLKPMIRFGVPVKDDQGRKKGVVLINYIGQKLLDDFNLVENSTYYMLLNSKGYWLRSSNPEDEWGFMYEAKKNKKLGSKFPDAWQIIKRDDSGQFKTKDGMFTFDTIYPHISTVKYGNILRPTQTENVLDVKFRNHYWKVVSHLPKSDLNSVQERTLIRIIVVDGILFVVLSIISWFLALSSVKRRLVENLIREKTLELQKFSLVVEQSPVSVVFTDLKGEIEYVNSKFSSVSGYSFEEAAGKKSSIISSGKNSNNVYKNLWETITSGQEWRGELINKKKNGELFWEKISITPIRDINHEISHFLAIKEDITEKKESDEVLKKRFDQLKQNRSAMLNIMEDLEIAKKGAESATKAKSSFLANMSHEIRTPMNAVLGFISLALEEPSTTTNQHKNLTTAFNSAKNLLRLINDILDLSKLESGKMSLDSIPFYINNLLQETIKTLRLQATEKKLTLNFEIRPEIPELLFGDPNLLKQVLFNLIGNSIKFTEKGGIQITVSPTENHDFIRFSVKDTGIGISPDRTKTIFNRFTQADNSTSRHYGGTGLGTTISKQLVELMQGEISVESEVGKGSTFHFTAHLPATDKVPTDTGFVDEYNLNGQQRSMRSFRVLVADDIVTNQNLVKIRLEQKGHTVFIANNGKEVIELFQNTKIDVILMDIQMPELDGVGATERIRQLESHPPVTIIALTASIMKEDIENYQQAGINSVIGKPIDFAELFSKMENIIPAGIGVINVDQFMEKERVIDEEFSNQELIDIESGLKIWQNSKAYFKALSQFFVDYDNIAQELSKHLKTGETGQAFGLAHNLKGVASNLSILKVAEIAASLHVTIRKNETNTQLLPDLASAIKSASNFAKSLADEKSKTANPKKAMDQQRLKSILDQIMIAYEQYNPDTIFPFLNQLREYLPDEQVDSIQENIERFEFADGKQKVLDLSKILKINLELTND